ncbi:hypothetical protein GCM10011581_48720 [Saccharopolyspora subtropica]|uniref:Uncharacterized protein n=1 Tax=Saccharopolyspora thermophila TaxID=89367 RepID=A0A917K997_9PSEU|nr:hypothetical protein [Saccharopolyspora subtropica]GGJ05921.1 hypothetical protein GCM10011581_48720 [Saccharopolyspora subtropica]
MTNAHNAPVGPTTPAQDALAATMAALMPLGGGLLLMLGYAWLGIFGLVLGVAGAAGWAFHWRNKHGAFFPKDLRGGSVGGFGALVAIIGFLLFVSL